MAGAVVKRLEGLRASRGGDADLAIDAFWALFTFAFTVAMIASGGLGTEHPGVRELDPVADGIVAVVLVALGSLPLVARRRYPLAVYLLSTASLLALTARKYPIDLPIAEFVAIYTLAGAAGRPGRLSRRAGIALIAASYAVLAVAEVIVYDELLGIELVVGVLFFAGFWLAGDRSQLREDKLTWLEERAERAEKEAERERRLAAAEERTRIARDLHDSAGHAINVILVEAGAARLLRDRDPERAEQALRTIEVVAREQIGEIDRLVHALRAEDEAAEPSPLSGDIPRGPEAAQVMLERLRTSGLDLDVQWLGEKRVLGPTVGRATFRILQEALTNAVRHGTGSARVVGHFRDTALELTIENPCASTANDEAPPGEGHGLTGMRERAGLLGGSIEVARSNGLFSVCAVLPYDPLTIHATAAAGRLDRLKDHLRSSESGAQRERKRL